MGEPTSPRKLQLVPSSGGGQVAYVVGDRRGLIALRALIDMALKSGSAKAKEGIFAQGGNADFPLYVMVADASKSQAGEPVAMTKPGKAPAPGDAQVAPPESENDRQRARFQKLNELIDMYAVAAKGREMAANMRADDAEARTEFEKAQAFVRERRDELAALGWRCMAIERLALANINDPADHPAQIPISDWYSIWSEERIELPGYRAM